MSLNQPSAPSATPSLSKQAHIVVLCGGLSAERDVSLRSGQNCFAALQRLGYENARLLDATRTVAQDLAELKPDLVYLALHGTYGEDGCIQGLLEWMGIPYTGNGVAASAITMDKALTKSMLAQAGLPVLPSLRLEEPQLTAQQLADIASQIGYPLMVKPLGQGSSVGMHKVESTEDLPAALKDAFTHDAHGVMLERFLSGASVTVGVFEQHGSLVVTPILELRVKSGWYDYTAKYTPGLTEFILPAALSSELTLWIQARTLAAHQALGCHGVSRTDWIIPNPKQAEGAVILEVNATPGMTDVSDLPAQAQAMGVSYDELVESLLLTALTRHRLGVALYA